MSPPIENKQPVIYLIYSMLNIFTPDHLSLLIVLSGVRVAKS